MCKIKMKAASVNDIKKELNDVSPKQLAELCLRLVKFKKENKELVTYLLFEAGNEAEYVKGIKAEITEAFETMNTGHLYFAKKSLRKILRLINKYARYSSVKETEIELRLFFCASLKDSGINYQRNTVINHLYQSQLKKSMGIIETLHEDLQYEYVKAWQQLAD